MFRRLVLICDLDVDLAAVVALVRRLAPSVLRVDVVARIADASALWLDSADVNEHAIDEAVASLRARLDGMVPELFVEVALEIRADVIEGAIARAGAEAVLFGPFAGGVPRGITEWMEHVARTARLPAVWSGALAPARPLERFYCLFDSQPRSLDPTGVFLRDHANESHRVTLVALDDAASRSEAEAQIDLLGVRSHIEHARVVASWFRIEKAIAEAALANEADLIVMPLESVGGIGGPSLRPLLAASQIPVLVAPALPGPREERTGELDAPDLLPMSASIVVRAEQRGRLGQPAPLAEGRLAVVARGRVVATLQMAGSESLLDGGLIENTEPVAWIGLGRVGTKVTIDAAAIVETRVAKVTPGERRVLLIDAQLKLPDVTRLHTLLDGDERHLVIAVRLHAAESFRAARALLTQAGFPLPLVCDARLLLDEGDPDDVPPEADLVRMCRIAGRLRSVGIAVDAVAHSGLHTANAHGFFAISAAELNRLNATELQKGIAAAWLAPPRERSLGTRLETTTGAKRIGGNRVTVQLRNDVARRSLLAAIALATERVHVQMYIIDDDPIAAEVERALADAAKRGVRVRVLVDSLYSLHGSFGQSNPLLDRLTACAGITVLASRPIDHMPTVEDLKQRDHRKLVIVDGRWGMISGRNLGQTYYRDFAEVQIGPRSKWNDVPWLDAGAVVEGPAVSAIEQAFARAWRVAGGDEFAAVENSQCGTTPVRVVIHRGLRDAHTLEAYIALIDGARERLLVVNSFPLQLEVQHALLGALARGVRLRILFGRMRPTYRGDIPFDGAGQLRELATQLVRARLDAVVRAGAEAYELAFEALPNWDQSLGSVRPEVHAKLIASDGEACAIGTANLDVTAGYWESEALLVIEDATLTRGLEEELEGLFAGSVRIDPNDPEWQRSAERRVWLGRFWPSRIG